MIIDVFGSSELREVAEEVVAAGRGPDPPDEVRIVLGPGDYKGVLLQLELPDTMPGATLALEAAEASRPVRLVDSRVDLDAARVRLAGLVLYETDSDAPLIRCRARSGITVTDCALHHNTSTAQSGGRLVEIVSATPQDASVLVRRSWFIANKVAVEGSALVGIDGFGANGFESVTFEDVAFIGNRVSRGIEAIRALDVQLSRVLIAPDLGTSGEPFVLVPDGIGLGMTDTHSMKCRDPGVLDRLSTEAVAQAEHGKPPDVTHLRSLLD